MAEPLIIKDGDDLTCTLAYTRIHIRICINQHVSTWHKLLPCCMLLCRLKLRTC